MSSMTKDEQLSLELRLREIEAWHSWFTKYGLKAAMSELAAEVYTLVDQVAGLRRAVDKMQEGRNE